jgi:hypothetical protein
MTSVQPKPSGSDFPTIPPLAEAGDRWWNTISCQTEELWQAVTSRDTGKIYKEAFWKTGQILFLIGRLLLLLILSGLGIFLFAWLLGYHSGVWARKQIDKTTPTPLAVLKKVWMILLTPWRLVAIQIDKILHEAFGWDLKLARLFPAETEKPAAEQSTAAIAENKT